MGGPSVVCGLPGIGFFFCSVGPSSVGRKKMSSRSFRIAFCLSGMKSLYDLVRTSCDESNCVWSEDVSTVELRRILLPLRVINAFGIPSSVASGESSTTTSERCPAFAAIGRRLSQFHHAERSVDGLRHGRSRMNTVTNDIASARSSFGLTRTGTLIPTRCCVASRSRISSNFCGRQQLLADFLPTGRDAPSAGRVIFSAGLAVEAHVANSTTAASALGSSER